MKQRYCSVRDCTAKHKAKNFCAKHYRQKVFKANNPLYRVWHNMKQRCYNPHSTNYARWGGRGITVCGEWLNNYQAFAEYMGPRPKPHYTLDRIDNNGNYEPGNVRWATPKTQANNKEAA